MGLLYANLYTGSIQPLFVRENRMFNHLLALYRSRPTIPADLGVEICDLGKGESLARAVVAISKLSSTPNITPHDITPEFLRILAPEGNPHTDLNLVDTLLEARSPLGCMSSIRTAIEEIVSAVEKTVDGSRVAPDDLIPLLAWSLVESGAHDLQSLLFFVKTYRLSDDLAAELE